MWWHSGKDHKESALCIQKSCCRHVAGVYVHPRHRAPGDLFINVLDTLDSHRLPCLHLQGVGYQIPLTGAYRQSTRNWRLTSNLYTAELTEMPTLLILRQKTFSELLETTYSNVFVKHWFCEDWCEHTDNQSMRFAQGTSFQASLRPWMPTYEIPGDVTGIGNKCEHPTWMCPAQGEAP